MSETTLMRRVMYALSQAGATVFRNNVGVAKYPDGSRVRYGLCPGSSDIIGWTPVTITPDMVGRTVAVFTAVEVKTEYGRTTAKQENFIARVREAGGRAIIVRGEYNSLEWMPDGTVDQVSTVSREVFDGLKDHMTATADNLRNQGVLVARGEDKTGNAIGATSEIPQHRDTPLKATVAVK